MVITFRAVLETATGLYRDRGSGRGYLRDELLQTLSSDDLAGEVEVDRIDRGTYLLRLRNGSERAYELFSRRRVPRESQPSLP